MLESVLNYCYRFQKLFVFVLKYLLVFLKCIFHYPVKSTRRNIKQYSSGKRLRNNSHLKHSPYCMPGTNKIRFSLKVQELINLNQTSTYAPLRILNTALIRSCHWFIWSSQNTAHGAESLSFVNMTSNIHKTVWKRRYVLLYAISTSMFSVCYLNTSSKMFFSKPGSSLNLAHYYIRWRCSCLCDRY